ncbi:hypothetical protein DID88_000877 [Monilinia fructigena]|uniref:Uncharacterized protein n=1 Tax=Monilinia fructigena TaxID=38457 RepID=A0A395J3U4_9HELO|nr:hypothetical protein DID88_000877 [Monilinia fructigena]
MLQVQAHAERTQHENFEQSTEEIAPLTEEEKKQKLAELLAKSKEKKAKQAIIDKEEAKRNEQIRMKSTKEVSDAKEKLAPATSKSKKHKPNEPEKAADIQAKKAHSRRKIAADKEERRLKAEAAKALREGRAPPVEKSPLRPPPLPQPALPKVHTEARLRLQTATGTLTKSLPGRHDTL